MQRSSCAIISHSLISFDYEPIVIFCFVLLTDFLIQTEAASLSIDEMNENDLNRLSRFLMDVLRQPTYEPPLVIVEEPIFSHESKRTDPEAVDEFETRPSVWKRSRYFRNYPWKRQNSRYWYMYNVRLSTWGWRVIRSSSEGFFYGEVLGN